MDGVRLAPVIEAERLTWLGECLAREYLGVMASVGRM